MKKLLISACVLTFISFSIHAQNGKHCYTTEVYNQTLISHPEIQQTEKQLEDFTQQYIQNNPPLVRRTASTSSPLYIIPLVFHVIHNYGPENISDAQIRDAVRILNRDYRKMNADTANIIPDFVNLSGDMEIEFRLATIDPNGNCTNGIDRVASFRTNIGGDLAKFNPWPHEKYLNIWTVASFDTTHLSAAAYAYRPGSLPSASVDGVIALNDYVGSIGTSNLTNSRTLTHEIGHCLNLQHPWGGTNQPGVACGDDGVSDTPITKGWGFCPTSNFDVCTTGINENFQNYMDYSYCDCMFTYGQKTRMFATLNSTVAGRNHLWSTNNLDSTGTNVGSPVTACAPAADFFVLSDHACVGDSIRFSAACFNADTINYSWSFPSGSPSSSVSGTPLVAYSAPGQYNVTLTASNAHGSNSKTKNAVVTVSGPAALTPNYFNDFEAVTSFPDGDGYIISDAGNAWTRITTTGYSGTACLKMSNYSSGQTGLVDSWVTPAIDLSSTINTHLTFRMAYAKKNPTWTDRLRVLVSSDCGSTWFVRKNLSGNQLTTTASVTGAFTPTSTSQWSLISVPTMPQIDGQPNARIKFEFTSGGNNNIYIDDVNITADPTGIQEAAIAAMNFNVFPNPSNDVFNIAFQLPASGKTEVIISDVIGREIKTVVEDQLSAGPHEFPVNTGGFSKGIYLVSLKTGVATTVKKLVID